MAVTLFRKLPPSVIASHASTFLDILQDDSQWGPDHCIRNNTVDLLRDLKCERMGVMGATYLEKLLSIQKTIIEKVAAFERKFVSTMVVLLNQPSLADVKARAKEMHDELYEPGAPGYEAAKASFEALAL